MANEPRDILLEYMRKFDAKLDHFGEKLADMSARISAVEKQMSLIIQAWGVTNERIDRIELRLDRFDARLERIERRIGLVEAES